jgi:hypothetical protein
MDPDCEMAAWHQLELECMERFETRDPAYEEWLEQFAACAAYEQEIEHADYC